MIPNIPLRAKLSFPPGTNPQPWEEKISGFWGELIPQAQVLLFENMIPNPSINHHSNPSPHPTPPRGTTDSSIPPGPFPLSQVQTPQ